MAALPSLRRYALVLTRNDTVADDLVQETVLRALQSHQFFERGTNLSAWLSTILRNGYFSRTRVQRREVQDTDGIYANALSVQPDQVDKLVHQDLAAAIELLPETARVVLELVVIEGLSYEEAAVRMSCATGTIKSRLFRARKELATKMGLTEADVIGISRN